MIKREFQFLESLILLQLALIGNLFYRFNTDNWKISGFRERKKNKSEKSIRHARQKGYLKIHLNYFFIKRTENYLFLMK